MNNFEEQLKKSFQKTGESTHLSVGEKESLRDRLTFHMREHPIENKRDAFLVGEYQQFIRSLNIFRMQYAAPALAVMLILGTSVASAAEGALPGHWLYPVKLHLNEEVVTLFSISDEGQTAWDVRRAERRLEEADALAAQGALTNEVEEELAARFAKHANAAVARMEKVGEENPTLAVSVGSAFEATVEAHGEIFAGLGDGAPEVADVSLANTIGEVSSRLAELQETVGGVHLAINDTAEMNTMALKSVPSGEADEAADSLALESEEGAQEGPSSAVVLSMKVQAEEKLQDAEQLLKEEKHKLPKDSVERAEKRITEAREQFNKGEELLSDDPHGAFEEFYAVSRNMQKLSVLIRAEARFGRNLISISLPELQAEANENIEHEGEEDKENTKNPVADPSSAVPELVSFVHTYKNGIHEYRGNIMVPTPCDTLHTDSRVEESAPETIVLELSTTASADMCTEVVAEKGFFVRVAASEEANTKLFFNGVSVPVEEDFHAEGDLENALSLI